MPDRFRVYLILGRRGEAGKVYVGQTRQTLAERLYQHKTQPSNMRVYYMLANRKDYAARIVSAWPTQAAAEREEGRLVEAWRAKGRDVLNRFTPGREGAELMKTKPRTRTLGGGWYRCNLCERRLQADNFHLDRTRTSGLAGRCIQCCRYLRRGRQDDKFVHYGRNLAELREWAQAHRAGDPRPHPAIMKLPPYKPSPSRGTPKANSTPSPRTRRRMERRSEREKWEWENG